MSQHFTFDMNQTLYSYSAQMYAEKNGKQLMNHAMVTKTLLAVMITASKFPYRHFTSTAKPNNAISKASFKISTVSTLREISTLLTTESPVRATHLESDADADEGHHERVELVLFAGLQHVAQLRCVSRQQRHVQHPLRDRLLGGIPVRVELLLSGERETG